MKVFILALVLGFSAPLSADPHPHEQNPLPPPGDVEVTVPVDVSVPVDINNPVNTEQNIDIEDEKQAPGMALSTASDSLGLGITTPIGGILLNLPWSFGDRKKLAVCDRIAGTFAWGPCMCKTSVLKDLYEEEDCVKRLGKN